MLRALLILILFTLPISVFSKAAYYGKGDMIKQAEIIAIVDIQTVRPAMVKGKHWTYSEVASANVERVIKGKLPSTIKLYGGENFICAQVRYKPGKFLVFLRRHENLLAGVNWHLGVRAISDGKIEWFANNSSLRLTAQELGTVLAEIEAAARK